MPPFPKPSFEYGYHLAAQLSALREWRDTEPGRAIPAKARDRLLVATWNIANLGVQQRRPQDYALIAEIISWFDLTAVQEVNDNLAGLRAIHDLLPSDYRLLFSDAAGNNERLTYIYDWHKVTQLEEIGELSVPPSQLAGVELEDSDQRFEGFDRNPFLGLFRAGSWIFQLANVHLYFGTGTTTSMNRRRLETLAVARWAERRQRSAYASTRDIIPLGDFNLPKTEPGDPIFDELTGYGLHLPEHSTEIGSSIAEDKEYDQIAFFPGETEAQFTGRAGVFDFDGALFRTLWEEHPRNDFLAYMRHYVSDHRTLWAEFAT